MGSYDVRHLPYIGCSRRCVASSSFALLGYHKHTLATGDWNYGTSIWGITLLNNTGRYKTFQNGPVLDNPVSDTFRVNKSQENRFAVKGLSQF